MTSRTITFSKNVFLPLTTVCRNRCGYCIFRTPVGDGCIMTQATVTGMLSRGAMLGCTEALFTFGEKPEIEPGFETCIRETGFESILEYCYAMCRESIRIGLLPHTNAGVLDYNELAMLKPVNASMGLMLETTAILPAHQNSPGKVPEARIETIENAGKLRIPFTTGLLLGIGETMEDREDSLTVIRDLHRRYDHIQEVIIQNFCPKPGTAMAFHSPISFDEFCVVIRMARDILPDDIAIQVAPNLADAPSLTMCGVDDLGGISPLTIDYVNPEHPWPEVEQLRKALGDTVLKERLCIYPKYIGMRWFSDALEPLIMRLQSRLDIQDRVTENTGNSS